MEWLPQNDGAPSNWQNQAPELATSNPPIPPEDSTPSVWQGQTPEGTSMTQAEYEATISAQAARDAALAAQAAAETSAAEAVVSATASAGSAADSLQSALDAELARAAAVVARLAAEAAQAAALASQTTAATSATNAANSATAAAASAAAAATFNPALYALKSGATFTGNITISNSLPAIDLYNATFADINQRRSRIVNNGGTFDFQIIASDDTTVLDTPFRFSYENGIEMSTELTVRDNEDAGAIIISRGGSNGLSPGSIGFYLGAAGYEQVGYIGDKVSGQNKLYLSSLQGWEWLVEGKMNFPASTTTKAPVNIPPGTAPTTPVTGDIYTGTTGFFVYLNGAHREVAWRNIDNSFTGKTTTKASASGGAGFAMLPGAAPTSPVDGDMWITTGGALQARLNGSTATIPNLGGFTMAGTLVTAAPGASNARFRLTPGVDVTSGLTDGDMWAVGAAVKARLSGATRTFILDNDARLTDARAPTAHDHNSIYYTEGEVDTLLASKLSLDGGGGYQLTGSAPWIRLHDTDSPSGARRWSIAPDAGKLGVYQYDDAGNWIRTIVEFRGSDGKVLWGGKPLEFHQLTDAATIAVDLGLSTNFIVTLSGNRTLGTPSGGTVGQSGLIIVKQDGTGGRTLAYGSSWNFTGGTTPVITTTANARNLFNYTIMDDGTVRLTLSKA